LVEADQYGTGNSFFFRVNGVPVFAGGESSRLSLVYYNMYFPILLPLISSVQSTSNTRILGSNWIPADNFLTTISDDRYRQWLTLARDGGQNMIRIWGGGIYEPDVFYDVCDGE
jgi:beta-mannosidase